MEVTRLPKEKKRSHKGLLAHYNICVESDTRVGMTALWRVPCDCNRCINQLDLKNVGARYASSIMCKYWDIFEGLNDWKITKLVPGSENFKNYIYEANQMVLHRIVMEAAEKIKMGEIGSFLQMTQTAMVFMLSSGHQSHAHYRKPSLLTYTWRRENLSVMVNKSIPSQGQNNGIFLHPDSFIPCYIC
jgi:hypothetical protein